MEDSRFFLKSILMRRLINVTEAENGKVAVALLQNRRFDLVMTDIRMPEMDGLTLLRHIRRNTPGLPVIIVTGYREPETVIEALRCGACDYITKPYNAEEITNSIQRVSRLSEAVTADMISTCHKVRESKRYIFPSDPEQVNAIAQYLCRDLENEGLHSEKQLMQVSLIEAINNAIFHGNLELSSNIKTTGNIDSFDDYKQLAMDRLINPAFCERKVTVDYLMDQEKILFCIRDEGVGFNFRTLADPLDPESFRLPSGRGLLMIRTFCDEVFWNETGNEITLVKYLEEKGKEK